MVLYFADVNGILQSERRTVAGENPLGAALDALVAGPTDSRLLPALPEGSRILSVAVADRTVTVDLSGEFETNYPSGGSSAELAVVAPLVRTAAEAAAARAVILRVEGRVPAPIGSQIDFAPALEPGAFG